MTKNKVSAVVKFSKGITISKDFQSVRYDVGLELVVQLGPNGEGFREELAKLEEKVNTELRRRVKPNDFHNLG